ncbi:hypothetical protein Dred_0802 [Desulforamulus reducens MI-1]|uniref:AAA domain-containing protein n=1 Tax=Desulforamulus reducens (strain ATCC BAA-1160 / DSM 100696 / MI-1) TaxID=349161 RepID=A4J2N7_DESRM|nr:AAA family ATPase [Desulforamulus reducens]ABO49340.1 hypothetical protein Dred_0802 [Desulforamulus reducens MI-1]
MNKIKLFVSGPREFVDYITHQVENNPGAMMIVNVSTEPSQTVAILESGSTSADVLLLGFDDRKIETMVQPLSRFSENFPIFISAKQLSVAHKKWKPFYFNIAREGGELSAITRYFKDRPQDIAIPERASVINTVASQARVEHVKERENRIETIPVDKKVITVFGQKGGIGKTCTVVSVSQSLSTLTTMSVCVLDLDMNRDYGDILRYFGYVGNDKVDALTIERPDWAGQLKLPTEKTLSAWTKLLSGEKSGDGKFMLSDEMRLNKKLVEHCLIKIKPNLFFLPPVRTIMDEHSISETDVRKIISILRRHFSTVIIDGGNTLSTQTVSAISESDDLLIMAEAAIASFDSLADFTLNTLNIVKGHAVPRIIINMMMDKDKIPRKQYVDPEKELPEIVGGFPVIAVFPWDDELNISVRWKLIVPYYGAHDTPFTREMPNLLKHLYPKEIFSQAKEKDSGNGFFRFFKKFLALGGAR